MECTFVETKAASALNKLKRKTPFGWDLNIYKGCAHGCAYCYALYSHPDLVGTKPSPLDAETFSRTIHVKTNIVERLERELAAPSWKREVVNIGGVTDSYQPCEASRHLMPDILRLLIKYKTPAIISTKSVLVLRDFDLIDELSRITYINVASTVTTMDESVRAVIEPGAAPSASRIAMLKEFRKTNASVGLHDMPIIPYITDSRENLDALYAAAHDAGVHYVLPGALYLRGRTKPAFLAAMDASYPEVGAKLRALFLSGSAGEDYKNGLYRIVNELRAKYGLSSSWSAPMKEKLPPPAKPLQQDLFI